MKTLFIILQDAGGGNPAQFILIIGFMLIFMYFFMFRPQQKRMKEAKEFMSNLEKGQNVVTSGGIHGKVSSVQETTIVISTDSGKLTVEKSAVSANYTPPRQ